MSEDILKRAKALLGNTVYAAEKKVLPARAGSLARAREVLEAKCGLDVYIVFDTTGSMSSYIDTVRDNLTPVTDALLGEKFDNRISINGVGDHCDGDDVLQMYALTNNAFEAQGSIDSIVMTDGGDIPEAYECMALAIAKRLPKESEGRKRAVVLVGDSVPHGMTDSPCKHNVNYAAAFEAMKLLCDGFYFVGCEPRTYQLQRQLIDARKSEREQFIPLGDMVDVLPALLIALAKKTESEKALADYLKQLGRHNSGAAQKVAGLLTK
ncbi:hypothetical protein HZB03_02935 [Candidatus Woesearchaeota archaeon]|nr:hypothetical protein [Candidatus Woesearchaeota archaeon]